MLPAKNILGKYIKDISPLPELTGAFEKSLKNKTVTNATFSLLRSTYMLIVSPIKDTNDSFLGVVGIMADISEMEKVEQLRRDFIANVSHEFRAPITVISGYIDCLLDEVTELPPEHYYKIIKSETGRLERLIKDLMDLSLLQSGKAELEPEEVDLSLLIQGILSKFYHRAEINEIQLLTNTDKQNIMVYCDPDRIEQLLIILLDNALKFTPPKGKVEINLEEKDDKVEVIVRDTGKGIPKEDIPFIWERFYKADKSRNRQFENGTGLGLSIAKQIAELHQAEIEVESILDQGTTFTIKLKK
jgi:two-component system sensor histidine kinase ResE